VVDRESDVLIVGGGIIGCAIARELARRGLAVRLFDARSIGAGATQASAGMLVPYLEAHERGALFDLTIRSLALYDRFVSTAAAESGIDVEYRRCGSLQLAVDAAAAQNLRDLASTMGSDVATWLDADGARSLEPALDSTIHGALHMPTHGYVAVGALTEALAWSGMRHGAEIETHRRIVRIAGTHGRAEITADDGATWEARWVVAAPGSWLGELGVSDAAARDVRPVRGQLLRLKWQGEPIRHILWGPECYLVPWTDGTVLVGATVEEVGFDERTTAAGVRDLLDAACDLLPEAWRATFLEARVGLRPASSDGLPIIGPSATIPSLVFASGHYRNGVLLAPVTAQIVADYIVENRSDPALTDLDPSRFRPAQS
jgi:glycine oxidase